LFDDFINVPTLDAVQNIRKYASYIDTGVTITQTSDEGGVYRVGNNDAANDQGHFTTGGNTGGAFRIDSDDLETVAFETRFRKSSVTDGNLAHFAGLFQPASVADQALVDTTGVPADKDYIGFLTDASDGDTVNFVYRKEGSAQQVAVANLATLAANTFVKLGFKIDPDAPPSKRLKLYVNSIEQSQNYISQSVLESALFPDDEPLTPTFLTTAVNIPATNFDIDWYMAGQGRG